MDTGLTVSNPITGEEVPLWIANYVLMELRQRRSDGGARPRSSATGSLHASTTCRSPR